MIEGGAFSFGGITSITIPDSILHIGEEALVGNNLDSIILPNSVVSIVYGTFYEFEGDLYIINRLISILTLIICRIPQITMFASL